MMSPISECGDVGEYYSNKSIFLTGGTGFVGKVFIEKLLRSCPQVKAIYCLIRPKKGKLGEDRLKDILQEKLFEKLRSEQPDFEQKVHAVHGDVVEDRLGMQDSVRSFLTDNIDIIIHSAATIRFDEHIRLATELNVVAVRRMVTFAKEIKNLEALIHLSTAYSNCERQQIEEVVYSPAFDYQKLIDLLPWMDDDTLTKLTPKLLGNKPNSYTLTKHLAEVLLVEEGKGLNLAIIRPSIVTAVWKEPLMGWVDNYNGPSGLYVATGKGILRSLMGSSERVADIVPVDLLVNLMITCAWYTATAKPSETYVYHMTSGGCNPFTWGQMSDLVTDIYNRIPLDKCFRRPNLSLTANSLIHDYWLFASHMVPAFITDLLYHILGQKPRMVRIYTKLHKMMNVLQYFILREWEWVHNNTDMLREQLSPKDRETFYFDPRAIHWATYTENYCLGTKMYLLKEDLTGLPAARAHMQKLRNIRYTFNTILVVLFWRLLVARTGLAKNMWSFIMTLVSKFLKFFRLTSSLAISKTYNSLRLTGT